MLGVPSFPAAASPQRQGGRNKVALRPGRSLMDWIRLTKGGEDIQGFKGRTRPVTKEELESHNTEHDCWIAIRGHVYNVTRYMEYHPGGIEELMKGAGKDATQLFDQVHKWVNFSSMLGKCYIGPLKYEAKSISKNIARKKENVFLAPTSIPLPRIVQDSVPRYDWYEKGAFLVLSIYAKSNDLHSSDVIIDCENGKILDVKVLMESKYYWIHLSLEGSVKDLKLEYVSSKKIDIKMTKLNENIKWIDLGTPLQNHNMVKNGKDRELKYRNCQIVAINEVTHDTRLYTLELPHNCYYETPVGHHIQVKGNVNGMEVVRSYTITVPLKERFKSYVKKGKQMQLMIKYYNNGALTPSLHSLKIGDHICVSDCIGTFRRVMLKDKSKAFLIAAGTGLTPMIRIMNYYLYEADVKCEVNFLFANKEERDILWKNVLDEQQDKFPSQLHVTHVLSKPHQTWNGFSGRINQEIMEKFVFKNYYPVSSSKDKLLVDMVENTVPQIDGGNFFAICGPTEFTSDMKRILLDIGISDSNIHCFLG